MILQYELVLEEAFHPENGGRAYYSETVVQLFEDKSLAQATANDYNRKGLDNQYFSVREAKDNAPSYEEEEYSEPSEATEWADYDPDC